jgi:multiple sugar transport system permease protein
MFESRRGSIVDKIISVREGLKLGNQEGQKRLDMLLKEESLPPFNWPLGIAAMVALAAIIIAVIYWPERKIKYTQRMKSENIAGYKFISPWLAGLLIFTLGPMLLSLLMSFMRWDMILPAQFRGLHNYTEAFVEDERFWISLRVTGTYCLISTPLGIFCATLLALLMNQKVKGIPLFRAMYYMPSIASAVAMTLVTRKILSPEDGLLNTILYKVWPFSSTGIGHALSTYAGKPDEMVNWLANEKTALASILLISLTGVGGSMVILLAGLQGIPHYYYEAATVDGATPFQRLKAITLPMLTPALFFSLVTGFIGSFQVFTQVFIITNGDAGGGPNHALLVYMISLFSAAFQSLRMGYAAALAWVLFFIVMIFTLLQFRLSKWVYYETDTK